MQHLSLFLFILLSLYILGPFAKIPHIYFSNLSTFRFSSVKPQDSRLAHPLVLPDLSIGTRRASEWMISRVALRWESEGHTAITLPPSVPSTTTTITLFWSLIITESFVCSYVLFLCACAFVCMQASCYTTKWFRGEEIASSSDRHQNRLHICQYLHFTSHWYSNIHHTPDSMHIHSYTLCHAMLKLQCMKNDLDMIRKERVAWLRSDCCSYLIYISSFPPWEIRN